MAVSIATRYIKLQLVYDKFKQKRVFSSLFISCAFDIIKSLIKKPLIIAPSQYISLTSSRATFSL